MARPRHAYDLESPSRNRGPRGGSKKPRVNYVRSKPAENGGYVKVDRTPPPITLHYLAWLDPAIISTKPEHLR